LAPLFSTDKIPRYYASYLRIAADLGIFARVCEVGVAYGGSLTMWRALFPCGDITGVDNSAERTWPEGVNRLIMDQNDPGLPRALGGTFDLIVDDASHEGFKTRRTFDLLWPLVNPGGYYVVEDWMAALEDGEWGPSWGQGLLRTVESFLPLLGGKEPGEADAIDYRWGLCIIHRRKA
jgi:hypothetical protein